MALFPNTAPMKSDDGWLLSLSEETEVLVLTFAFVLTHNRYRQLVFIFLIMTEQQIKNSIQLCKNQPVSKILQLFNYWGNSELKAMANYFNCREDKHEVALHLMMGR